MRTHPQYVEKWYGIDIRSLDVEAHVDPTSGRRGGRNGDKGGGVAEVKPMGVLAKVVKGGA